MADENTTDSTSTDLTLETPAADSKDTSTTETPTPEGGEDTGTLLTPPPAKEGEEKPAEEKPKDKVEQTPEEKAKAELFGAPEGDYELTGLPEGTVIDDKALAAITPLAKELGLSSVGMSKIASVYANDILPQVTNTVVDGIQRDVAAQHAAWATEAKELVATDEAFGKRPLAEVQQVSAKAIDRFGGAEFRTFLDETGLGNHPAMLKFAYLTGTAISEDTSFERGGASSKPKTSVEKFYGTGS